MRARDPAHEQQLQAVYQLSTAELIRRIGVRNHLDTNHLASEVLASLIRSRYRESERVVDAAVEELNRRMQIHAGKRLRAMTAWSGVVERSSTIADDCIDYIWDKLLADESPVSNSEVRFAVFVRERVDDFMRSQLAQKNSMQSVDAWSVPDEDGHELPSALADEEEDSDTPEAAAIRAQTTARVTAALMALPVKERHAYYYRSECEYEWNAVAEFMHCSVPTAKLHHQRALKKLLGELE